MKKVYVILSRTNTQPSKFIKLTTGAEFTHSSIAMTPDKHKLYSFARRKLNNFLVGGFVYEDVDKFIFAKYPYSPCAVYEITVSDAAHIKMSEKLLQFEQKYQKYKYSFAGAAISLFGIRRRLKYKYTCSQFVASLLALSDEVELPKHPSLMKPMDFTKMHNAKLIYSGTINNISFNLQNEK